MRVLVLSNTTWDVNNSFGNSFSNIFSGIPDLEFANICCHHGELNNEFNMRCFQITERSLISNLKNPHIPSGKEISPSVAGDFVDFDKNAIPGFKQARKMRWQIMFWMRDLIWKLGRWKSEQLMSFLDDFKPDLIFQPIYYSGYICDIALFIKDYTGVPMIGYISDDNYTLKRWEFSPLYWIDRIYKRKKVKAVIDKCEILYVISQIQKEEYEAIFTPVCKILTKCADFNKEAPKYPNPQKPIKLIYAGNLGLGRWESLALITNAVEEINKDSETVRLDIYTATPLTNKMKRALSKRGCVLHGSISYAEAQRLQKDSDVLIHVEGLSLKSRLAVHQSFSTKLVDYFAMGKCILAIGTYDEASIRHLIDNDAAIVCSNQKDAFNQLKQLCSNSNLIADYGKKAYACGAKYHNRLKIQQMLLHDMKSVLE